MGAQDKKLDLICMGRCNVDLYAEQVGARLRDVQSFCKYVGGSAANICLGSAQLGLKCAMITAVGDDQLGWYVRDHFAQKGVDVSAVRVDKNLMTPQIFLALHEPSHFERIFDYPGEKAADLAVNEDDVDPQMLASARALLVTGTLLSRPGMEAAARKAIAAIKAAGGRVAFDVDYRPVLWGLASLSDSGNMFVADAATTARLQSILPECDLIVGTEEEIHILGGATDTVSALQAIRALTKAAIVLKRGAQGSAVFDGAIPDDLEQGIKGPVFPVEVYNTTGAGDGFMSGFLLGWIEGKALQECCRMANACGAIVVSRHGCAAAGPSRAELDHFLAMKERPEQLRHDAALNHLHWATVTRGAVPPELHIMAFDHRWQFEEMPGADMVRIAKVKNLLAAAFKDIAQDDPCAGTIIDGQYGSRALEGLNGEGFWLSQAVEVPRATPLRFVGGRNVGLTLQEWPQEHVIKCLVFHDPQNAGAQDEQILSLYEAARALERELLFEILPVKGIGNDDGFAAAAMVHFYALGIKPDWWKLEAPPSDKGWARITETIAAHDSYCRGVLLLGKDAPMQEIGQQFVRARRHPVCKGFAIGRTIWAAPVREWLEGKIDDRTLVKAVSDNYKTVIDLWKAADPAAQRKAVS